MKITEAMTTAIGKGIRAEISERKAKLNTEVCTINFKRKNGEEVEMKKDDICPHCKNELLLSCIGIVIWMQFITICLLVGLHF